MEELTLLVSEELGEAWENEEGPEAGVWRAERQEFRWHWLSVGSFWVVSCWTIWWRHLQEVSWGSRSGWTRKEGWQRRQPKLLTLCFLLIISVLPAPSLLPHQHEEPWGPTKRSEPFPDYFIKEESSLIFSCNRGSRATGMMEARGLLGILGLFFLWITAQAQMKIPPET